MQHTFATSPTVQIYEVSQVPAIFAEKKGEKIPWVRLLSGKVQPDKVDEMRKIYYEDIAQPPTPKGLIDLFMLESPEERGSIISCTLWDNMEDCEAYHAGEAYAENVRKVQHLLAGTMTAKFYKVQK